MTHDATAPVIPDVSVQVDDVDACHAANSPSSSPHKRRTLIELWRAGKHTSTELAELFSVARSTIYRAVQRADEPASAA